MKMKHLILILASSLISYNSFAGSVIVHPSNGDALDDAAISRIFLGKSKSFPGGEQAVPINMDEGAAVTEDFNTKVLSKSSSQLKAYWSKLVFTGKGTPPTTAASDAEMIKLISANPNMIGFIEGSGDGSVKVVKTF
jgi:ABC-type phosphate transport system substrate-binding protein